MKTIIPNEYPQLKFLCWNINPENPIPEEFDFGIYERNWRHIDRENLTESETALIHNLTRDHGHGKMMVGHGL